MLPLSLAQIRSQALRNHLSVSSLWFEQPFLEHFRCHGQQEEHRHDIWQDGCDHEYHREGQEEQMRRENVREAHSNSIHPNPATKQHHKKDQKKKHKQQSTTTACKKNSECRISGRSPSHVMVLSDDVIPNDNKHLPTSRRYSQRHSVFFQCFVF